MNVFMRNRSILHFDKAKSWRTVANYEIVFLELLSSRGRVVFTAPLDAVDGWCFDNEELTHYFHGEKATQLL